MTEQSTLSPSRRVVSAPARAVHAILAISFGVAYLTGDSDFWQTVHVTIGYTVLAAIALRVLWGVVGPRSEQTKVWAHRTRAAGVWAKALVTRPRLQDMTPDKLAQHAVSLSIAALVSLLIIAAATGWLIGLEWSNGWVDDGLSEVHEFMANGAIAAVCLHLGAVLILAGSRGSGWVMRMWHGRIQGKGPDLVKHNSLFIALTITLATLGFWVASLTGWVQVVG